MSNWLLCYCGYRWHPELDTLETECPKCGRTLSYESSVDNGPK